MSAFDPKHKKQKTKPMSINLTTATTPEIIQDLGDNYVGALGQLHIAELKAREIKTGDSDADAKHTGGTRPEHQPLNP